MFVPTLIFAGICIVVFIFTTILRFVTELEFFEFLMVASVVFCVSDIAMAVVLSIAGVVISYGLVILLSIITSAVAILAFLCVTFVLAMAGDAQW